MKAKKMKYGNASQVTEHSGGYGKSMKYADGGKVAGYKPGNSKQHMEGKKKTMPNKSTGMDGDTMGMKYGANNGDKSGLPGLKDGGKISNKKKKPTPKMLGSGSASNAGKKLSGRRRQLDKAIEAAGG